MPGLLENHIAAVTGAGSGIGRAIASGYAREGAQVALIDINDEAASEAAEEIRRAGGGFTRALAAELGKYGVRVNAIGPGLIETPLNAAVRASNPELVKVFIDHTPLGRAGKPEDIAGPAIFLASDLSAYVTGSIVMADGGYRAI